MRWSPCGPDWQRHWPSGRLRPPNMDPELSTLLDFEKGNGLVTAIAQDHRSNEILMVAFMNEEAFRRTLDVGQAVYWSRSRSKLWPKGEESGNIQIVKELYIDCDADVVLMKVEQIGGAACHTGRRSCFFRKLEGGEVSDVGVRVFDPDEVYRK